MRKIYLTLLIAGILIAISSPIKAQLRFNFNVNISSQPVWGPVGYEKVQYYYLPDIDAYYYVPQHRFYYQERGRWITSSSLPPRYRNYNLYEGHKVVMNSYKPYEHDRDNREKYSFYKNRHDQQQIRDSRDSKYFVNKNHPEHNNWVKQQRHDNGQDKGRAYSNQREKNNKQDKHGNQNRNGNHKK